MPSRRWGTRRMAIPGCAAKRSSSCSLLPSIDGIAGLALSAAAEGCPADAQPLLERIATSPARASAVRAAAVRVLARTGGPETVRTLVDLALARRRWLGRTLASKSPELLAALAALAGRWREEPAAAAVLRHALHHPDAEVRNAARGLGP